MVDAAHKHIGFALQDLVNGKLHAVHGCSGCFVGFHAVHAEVVRRHAQDVADRDGVAHPALVAVGCDNHDVPEVGNALHEVADAGGSDAVVVGDEDQWACRFLTHAWASGVRFNTSRK